MRGGARRQSIGSGWSPNSMILTIRTAAVVSLIAASAMAAPASSHEFKSGAVTVVHPWARATAAGIQSGEVFFEIKSKTQKSKGGKPALDRLVAAKAEASERAEIHQFVVENGVRTMRRIDRVALPPGQSLIFKPGGYHIMLQGLKGPLKEGDLLPVTLTFENAGELTIEATVEPPDASGPHGFDHQPGHGG